jgi:hypothetical protein
MSTFYEECIDAIREKLYNKIANKNFGEFI